MLHQCVQCHAICYSTIWFVLCCTVACFGVLYFAMLHCTVLCYAVLCCYFKVAVCGAWLCCTQTHSTMQCGIVLYHAVLYCTVRLCHYLLYCTVQCGTVGILVYTILRYAVQTLFFTGLCYSIFCWDWPYCNVPRILTCYDIPCCIMLCRTAPYCAVRFPCYISSFCYLIACLYHMALHHAILCCTGINDIVPPFN